MTGLKNISIGWRWLANTLNRMIDGINARSIIPSATIAVQESPNGVILTVTKPQGDTGGGAAPDVTTGAWRKITIASQDDSGRTQLQDMLVWSQPPGDPYPCH